MNGKGRILLFLAALLLLPFSLSAAQGLSLRAEAHVQGPVVRLSHVFEGIDSSLDREIAAAPVPGQSVAYDVRILTGLAEKYGLDWRPESLADKIVITRRAVHITPDMIKDVIMRKIKLAEHKGAQIEIRFDGRRPGLSLPAEEGGAFDVTGFVFDPESNRFRGELLAQNGGRPISQPLSGQIVVRKNIPALARSLPAGTVLSEKDLVWSFVEEEKIRDAVICEATEIVGRELRRDQREGSFLRARDVMPPRLVTRGGLVTLKVETPFMLVTVQGRALGDGAKGEVVRVVNTQSNRMIEGTVESAGVVRVGAVRKIASAE